jgi:hypothetical protein
MILTNISKAEYHRNGVCGEPFELLTFEMSENGAKSKMLAIRFADRNPDKYGFECPKIAILDIEMLSKGIISMGDGNAWRGDVFADHLDQHFTILKTKEIA